jgi:hypothetical protein
MGVYQQQAMDAARGAGGSTTETLPGKMADDLGLRTSAPVPIDAASINALTQPVGVQDVKVTNPPPTPSITISLGGVHIQGVTDPGAIADRVAPIIGQRLRQEIAGLYADTSYGVA